EFAVFSNAKGIVRASVANVVHHMVFLGVITYVRQHPIEKRGLQLLDDPCERLIDPLQRLDGLGVFQVYRRGVGYRVGCGRIRLCLGGRFWRRSLLAAANSPKEADDNEREQAKSPRLGQWTCDHARFPNCQPSWSGDGAY